MITAAGMKDCPEPPESILATTALEPATPLYKVPTPRCKKHHYATGSANSRFEVLYLNRDVAVSLSLHRDGAVDM